MKRQIAYFLVIFIGFLALAGHFISYPPLNNFIDNDATQWFDIISGFAAFLGVINLLQLHLNKVANKRKNYNYSIITLLGFMVMIIFGFIYNGYPNEEYLDRNENEEFDYYCKIDSDKLIDSYTIKDSVNIASSIKDSLSCLKLNTSIASVSWIEEPFDDLNNNEKRDFVGMGAHLKKEGSAFYWMFHNIYLPLGATMFALLAFFVASASYRAFKIRNFEATLLLISGIFLMIGRVPIGQLIPWWMSLEIYICILFAIIANRFTDKKTMLYLMIFTMLACPFLISYLNLSDLAIFKIPDLQEWIMDVPATAGSRAIMIGIALGTMAQSYRIITGRERSILGD